MSWWQQLRRRLLRLAGRLRGWLADAWHAVRQACARHQQRAADDRGYARTVSTAVTELLATLIPRPVLATALAVALAGILTPDTPPEPAHRGVHDQQDYDPYPDRPRTAGRPASLWDRYE